MRQRGTHTVPDCIHQNEFHGVQARAADAVIVHRGIDMAAHHWAHVHHGSEHAPLAHHPADEHLHVYGGSDLFQLYDGSVHGEILDRHVVQGDH